MSKHSKCIVNRQRKKGSGQLMLLIRRPFLPECSECKGLTDTRMRRLPAMHLPIINRIADDSSMYLWRNVMSPWVTSSGVPPAATQSPVTTLI